MKEILVWLSDNWLTILFFIATVVLTLILTSRKILKYEVVKEKITLAKPKIDKLKITYDGKEIDKIFKVKIKVTNRGNKSISGSKIAKADPPRLLLGKNTHLLDYEIISPKKANNIKEKIVDNCIYLTFDYLDRRDYFYIDLILADGDEFKLIGYIEECRIKESNTDLRKISPIIAALITGVIAIGISTVIDLLSVIDRVGYDDLFFIILILAIMIICIITLPLLYLKKKNKKPKEEIAQ